jgi:SAM-dependent methyltransferase
MSKPIKREILMCPSCKQQDLELEANKIVCKFCDAVFCANEDKYYFAEYTEDNIPDFLDYVKYRLKKYHKLYNMLISLLSPVCTFNSGFKKFITKYVPTDDMIALNLGSGNSNIHKDISNVDIFRYDNVDMTADLSNLPIANDLVDVIVNVAVLEHVPKPEVVVEEFRRVLKPNGVVYCFFPFIQGYHASPYDYSRRTIEGIKLLFSDFDILEHRVAGGPTSGFLWIFQEYFAILLSFGWKPLYLILHALIMVLTFPIKFLDILLSKHPYGKNISTGFTIIARKREG